MKKSKSVTAKATTKKTTAKVVKSDLKARKISEKETSKERLAKKTATKNVTKTKVESHGESQSFYDILAEIRADKANRHKPYELLYIIPAQYTEAELTPLRKKVADLIQEFKGEIVSEQLLGKKKFAYEIKHINQGYYLLAQLKLPNNVVNTLNVRLSQSPEILRHLFVQVTPDQYAPKHTSTRSPKTVLEVDETMSEVITDEESAETRKKTTRKPSKAVNEEVESV